ncbi:MAG: hypothetical protein IPK79_11875 [Vampirovibrionales bacterium]|nr:hypothetical protein [Vampirovibrionales bacterium]
MAAQANTFSAPQSQLRDSFDAFRKLNGPIAFRLSAVTTEAVTPSAIILIKEYLQRIIYLQKDSEMVTLPSIVTIANLFETTLKEVKLALREFKKMGFNYRIQGELQPVHIWDAL